MAIKWVFNIMYHRGQIFPIINLRHQNCSFCAILICHVKVTAACFCQLLHVVHVCTALQAIGILSGREKSRITNMLKNSVCQGKKPRSEEKHALCWLLYHYHRADTRG